MGLTKERNSINVGKKESELALLDCLLRLKKENKMKNF